MTNQNDNDNNGNFLTQNIVDNDSMIVKGVLS